MDSIPQKICTKCGKTHPATSEYFYKKERGLYGLFAWCKKCHNAITKPTSTRWAKTHPERVKEIQKKYYYADPKRSMSRSQLWSIKNPDKARAIHARYAKNRPEDRRRKWRNRTTRKRNLPYNFTEANWQRALDYFGGCCVVCGRPPGLWHFLAKEHWIALDDKRPGNPGTVPSNIVPMCHSLKDGVGSCNNRKSTKDVREWLVSELGKRKAMRVLRRVEGYFKQVSEAQS